MFLLTDVINKGGVYGLNGTLRSVINQLLLKTDVLLSDISKLTFAVQSDVGETLRVPEVCERRGQVGAEAVPFEAVLLLLRVHARAASDTCPVTRIFKFSMVHLTEWEKREFFKHTKQKTRRHREDHRGRYNEKNNDKFNNAN